MRTFAIPLQNVNKEIKALVNNKRTTKIYSGREFIGVYVPVRYKDDVILVTDSSETTNYAYKHFEEFKPELQ